MNSAAAAASALLHWDIFSPNSESLFKVFFSSFSPNLELYPMISCLDSG
jgi:hypothetical protein